MRTYQYGIQFIFAHIRDGVFAAVCLSVVATALTFVTAPVTSQHVAAEDKAPLVLNGTAVHTNLQLDYYYAALFSEIPSADTAALSSQDNLRMELTILADDWSKRQFTRYWNQSIAINNSDEAQEALSKDVSKFSQLIKDSLIRGDHIQIEKIAGKGTAISINGISLIKSKSEDLFTLFVNVWVGQRPPSSGFKSSILGETAEINPALVTSYQSLKPSAQRKTEIKKWMKPAEKKVVAVKAPEKKIEKPLVMAELRPVGGAKAADAAAAAVATVATSTLATTTATTSTTTTTTTSKTAANATEVIATVTDTAAAATTKAAAEPITTTAANTASKTSAAISDVLPTSIPTTTSDSAPKPEDTDLETASVEPVAAVVAEATEATAAVATEDQPATSDAIVNAEDDTAPKDTLLENTEVSGVAAAEVEKTIGQPAQQAANDELLQVYRSNLLALTYRNISYPNSAIQRNREGKVVLKVTVNRDGEVKGVSYEKQSKFSALNRAANKAIAKSSPFPKIPEGIAGNEIELLVPINFSLSK